MITGTAGGEVPEYKTVIQLDDRQIKLLAEQIAKELKHIEALTPPASRKDK